MKSFTWSPGGSHPALLVATLLTMTALTACSNSTEDVSGTAGRMGPMSMGGVSYRDRDASGRRDADEPPVRGVRITLKQDQGDGCTKEVASMTTGDDGAFNFAGLAAGTYCLSATSDGLAPTSYLGDQSPSVSISEGGAGATVDIGLN